ncbi:hypothetical protein ACTMU2_11375 [Cupriavidus basilensis]
MKLKANQRHDIAQGDACRMRDLLLLGAAPALAPWPRWRRRIRRARCV